MLRRKGRYLLFRNHNYLSPESEETNIASVFFFCFAFAVIASLNRPDYYQLFSEKDN